jgi:hypothetical protein
VLSTRPLALVTGASAGIGRAFAVALAARGCDLVLTARREDRLLALAAELRGAHGAHSVVLPCDLATHDGAAWLADAMLVRGLAPTWLIANAGYGVPGHFDANGWETHAAFLRVMVEAPTLLAHRLLPAMRECGFGRIVVVSSLAAFVPGTAGHTLYGASKAYLVRFCEALAAECIGTGVNISALCPGFTRSEFHDVTGTRARVGRLPGFLWQDAEAVALAGIAAVERGEAVHVPGTANRAIRHFTRLLPPGLSGRLARRQSNRFRETS